jgi:hypothetical protein
MNLYYDVFVEQITNQPQWQEKTAQPNDYFIPHSLLLLDKQSYNQKIIKQTAKEKKDIACPLVTFSCAGHQRNLQKSLRN